MPSEVRVLVITGVGLNCEAETTHAFRLAGAAAEQVHLNDILDGRRSLDEFHIVAMIGGFSFGDHIGGGKVLAIRLRHRLGKQLQKFIADGKLMIGICNGFQTMVKLGILPGGDGSAFRQTATLAQNDSGVFRDAWVHLGVEKNSRCVFTRGLDRMYLPVRHGEGKFTTIDKQALDSLESGGMVALRYVDPERGEPTNEYPHNPNGSVNAIAGICSKSGRLFGLMPHPEAFLSPFNHPHWMRNAETRDRKEGAGLAVFRNAVKFAAENLV